MILGIILIIIGIELLISIAVFIAAGVEDFLEYWLKANGVIIVIILSIIILSIGSNLISKGFK